MNRRILELLRPHTRALVVAGMLAAVIAACRGALVWLVREVLDGLLVAPDGRAMVLVPAAVVALFLVQGAARAGRTWLSRRAAIQAEAQLRERLFAHLLASPPAAIARDGVGDGLSRRSHDAGKVRTAMGAIVTLVQRPLSAIVLLGVAAAMAPHLFVWTLLGLPVVALVIHRAGAGTRVAARRHGARLGRLEALARDALLGARTLQAHDAVEAEVARFAEANEAQVEAAMSTTAYQVVGPPLVELAAATSMAAVIALGALGVRDGTLTAGELVAFLVALGLLHEPLKGFAVAHGLWSEARGALARVFEALDRPGPAPDGVGAVPLAATSVDLVLAGVTVDRGRGLVLRGLDLRLPAGTITALSGPSGVGKSTLLDVIAGFCPYEGQVRWNDTEAQRLTLSSRRAHVALVEQDPWLGAGTVADAIRLGRPDACLADVEQAARRAGLSLERGLLSSLSGGLQGRVGDGGERVSGGERQRIALARALLRRAPLLLLDEPTAHLDPEAEQAFLATLRELRATHTILIATHRSAPLAIADAEWALHEGTVARSGSRRWQAS